MASSDASTTIAAVRQLEADAPASETIEGERFVSGRLTDLLVATLAATKGAIDTTLAEAAVHARTALFHTVSVGPRQRVVPDLAVLDDDGVVRLVVELRSESTDRYALGMKRLAYQLADVPEFWFLEPRDRLVRRLTLIDRWNGFSWPPEELRDGDDIGLVAFPGVRVPVAQLFAGTSARAGETSR